MNSKNKVRSYNLVSDLIFLRYDFDSLNLNKLLSTVATEMSITDKNFKRVYILGNKSLSRLSKKQIAVLRRFLTSVLFHFFPQHEFALRDLLERYIFCLKVLT